MSYRQALDEALKSLKDNLKGHESEMRKIYQKQRKGNVMVNRPIMEKGKNMMGNNSDMKNYLATGMVQKSLSGTQGTNGGYLVPQTMTESIQQNLNKAVSLRALARVTNISTNSLDVLVDKNGCDVGWVSEEGERSDTKTPDLEKINIPVHEVYAKPRATQQLLDDAHVDVEEWLSQKVSDQMSVTENYAFINGNGEGKPKGILAYDQKNLGQEAHGSIGTLNCESVENALTVDNLIDLMGALKPQYHSNAVWLMSPSVLGALRKLKDSTDRFIWQPSLSDEMHSQLLGHKVYITNDMPAITDDKPVLLAFGNFEEGYQIVDRQEMSVLRDPFSAKPYVEFYATKRVGGAVTNFDAIKLLKVDQ